MRSLFNLKKQNFYNCLIQKTTEAALEFNGPAMELQAAETMELEGPII